MALATLPQDNTTTRSCERKYGNQANGISMSRKKIHKTLVRLGCLVTLTYTIPGGKWAIATREPWY